MDKFWKAIWFIVIILFAVSIMPLAITAIWVICILAATWLFYVSELMDTAVVSVTFAFHCNGRIYYTRIKVDRPLTVKEAKELATKLIPQYFRQGERDTVASQLIRLEINGEEIPDAVELRQGDTIEVSLMAGPEFER